MRLVAHLLRADVRRSRLPLAAWLVLAAVIAIIPCFVPTIAGGDARLMSSLELPIALVAVAYPLLLLVLVVHVVQTHPVVGSTAFWMTRPIPPRMLLLSKLALIGAAVIVAPVLIEIVRMIAHGVPWTAQVGVAMDVALNHAFLVALLMLGAVLTASMSRFLLLAGAVLVCAAILLAVMLVIGSRTAPPTSYVGWSVLPDPTPVVVQFVLFVLGMAGALLVQYVSRSRVRTIAVAAAGAALSILAGALWQWPLLRPAEVAPSWTHGDRLVVSADDPDGPSSFASGGFGDESWIGVRGLLRIDGIPETFSARVGVTEASLRVGGQTLASVRELYPATLAGGGEVLPQPYVVPRGALDVDRLAVWIGQELERPTLFFAGTDTVQRHAPSSGQYEGRVRVVLRRHETEAVLPLVVGQVHHRGAYRAIVDHIDRSPGSVGVHLHESRAASTFDRALHPRYTYYLRNQRLREAVPGSGHTLAAAANALRFVSVHVSSGGEGGAHGFAARELSLHFSVPSGPGGQGIVLDKAWVADAELVIVSTTRSGTVERELRIDDFPLAMPTRAGF